MSRFLLIGLAGALGTWSRHLVGLGAARLWGTSLPYGTWIVNVVGCFLMGAVLQAAVTPPSWPDTARLAATTGFLGGFTTYSAFNQETATLLRDRGATLALLYVLLTLGAGCAAGLLGTIVARRLAGG